MGGYSTRSLRIHDTTQGGQNECVQCANVQPARRIPSRQGRSRSSRLPTRPPPPPEPPGGWVVLVVEPDVEGVELEDDDEVDVPSGSSGSTPVGDVDPVDGGTTRSCPPGDSGTDPSLSPPPSTTGSSASSDEDVDSRRVDVSHPLPSLPSPPPDGSEDPSRSCVPSPLRSVSEAAPVDGEDAASSRVTHKSDPRANSQTTATTTSPASGGRRRSANRAVPHTALMKSTSPNMTFIVPHHTE